MNDIINLAVKFKGYDFLIWGSSIPDLFILLKYILKTYFGHDVGFNNDIRNIFANFQMASIFEFFK